MPTEHSTPDRKKTIDSPAHSYEEPNPRNTISRSNQPSRRDEVNKEVMARDFNCRHNSRLLVDLQPGEDVWVKDLQRKASIAIGATPC